MADAVNDLTPQIVGAASGPASAESAAGNKMVAQDLLKLCAADSYLARKVAASRVHRGLRFNGITAPGPMGVQQDE